MDVVKLLDSWRKEKDYFIKKELDAVIEVENEVIKDQGMVVKETIIKGFDIFKEYVESNHIDFDKVNVHVNSVYIVSEIFIRENILDWLDWEVKMFSEKTKGRKLLNGEREMCRLPFVLGNGVVYVNDWYEDDLEVEMMYELGKVMRFKKYMGDVFYDYVVTGKDYGRYKAYTFNVSKLNKLGLLSGNRDRNRMSRKFKYRVKGYRDIEGDVASKVVDDLVKGDYDDVLFYIQGSYENSKSVFTGIIKENSVEKVDVGEGTYFVDVDYRYIKSGSFIYDLNDQVKGKKKDKLEKRKLKGEGIFKVKEEDDVVCVGMGTSDKEGDLLDAYYGLHQLF